MNLQEYIRSLKSCIAAHPPDFSNEDSNAMYDEEIKSDFHILYEAMNGMPLREMDKIVYPICTLCRDHQKSGFIEGVRIGVLLCDELTRGSPATI